MLQRAVRGGRSSFNDNPHVPPAQMRRVAGWGLFDYLPSLGPQGKRALLQEVWDLFLDGTLKPYVGQRPHEPPPASAQADTQPMGIACGAASAI